MGSGEGLRGPAVGGMRTEGDAVVVALRGELDLYSAPEVRGALERAAEVRAVRIVVDLEEVEFVDSTAIAALVQARSRAGRGGVLLAAPTAEVRRALTVAGLDGYFDLRDSVADAVRG